MEQSIKKASGEVSGIAFKHMYSQVVISRLYPRTLLGDSGLAVGMPVVLVNNEREFS